MTQLLKTAALTVDFIDEARRIEAHGALSLMVQPILKKINERLAEEKPALVRGDAIIPSTWLPPIPSGPFRRLITNEARIAIGREVPQTVSIEVTRKCGCSCEHCTLQEGEGELSSEAIRSVIDQALDMGACIITFTEGDPLLRSDIIELVRYVDKERAVVNLFTPGLEMTPEIADALRDAGLYNLIIGVYSTDPRIHDEIRGVVGAHERALDAIRMGLKAGLLVTMSTHVNSERVNTLPELYELARELGVHELSVWEAIPRREEERLTRIDREKIIRFYRKMNASQDGPRVFASTYFEGEMLGCMAGRRWLHVGVDGGVRGCPYLSRVYGNVMDVPLSEIWKVMRRSGDFSGFRSECPAQRIV
ncbi:MAG: radical SAM protein [Methanothrix sp.]|nr:radical SAM protein [Methanothrix sp.]MCX8206530.1 radical SAM protein [Methanothrix sp.]